MVRGRWRLVFRGSRVVVFRAFFVFDFVPLLLFWFLPLPSFMTCTSRLAPMARTLLGGLGHAMLKFFVAAARLFLPFCVCPKICDLAKQRRKFFWGVAEVRKNDFSLFFVGCASLSWFFFPAAIAAITTMQCEFIKLNRMKLP